MSGYLDGANSYDQEQRAFLGSLNHDAAWQQAEPSDNEPDADAGVYVRCEGPCGLSTPLADGYLTPEGAFTCMCCYYRERLVAS